GQPADVAAAGTAGVRACSPEGRRLRIHGAAREAPHLRSEVEPVHRTYVDAANRRKLALTRSNCRSRRLDVERDLADEVFLALEGPLVAKPLPELDPELFPVEVAFEVEEERLDPTLAAAV